MKFMMTPLEYIGFGWKYNKALMYKVKSKVKNVETIHFVATKGTQNWILGAKARRLSKYSLKSTGTSFIGKGDSLPEADGYFFLHNSSFSRALRESPQILKKRNIIMFTHPVFKSITSAKHLVFLFNKADKVIFLNKAHADLLVSHGLNRSKTVIMHIASNAEMFQAHKRTGKGKIVVSMGYYERKNPELLMEIMRKMPHRQFILIGKDWNLYPDYENLKLMPNLEYHDSIPYEDYPSLYAQSDVFLSTSKLEGGPVPLLETMLCNLVPVASKTGFCVDIINHGENGFLFDIDATAEDVIPMIETAYALKTDTRECVIDYTWEKSAKKIDELFEELAEK